MVGDEHRSADTLGVPRFTMTACDGRLYARMGNPRDRPPAAGRPWPWPPATLVCLDLEAEGKLLWKTAAGRGLGV